MLGAAVNWKEGAVATPHLKRTIATLIVAIEEHGSVVPDPNFLTQPG